MKKKLYQGLFSNLIKFVAIYCFIIAAPCFAESKFILVVGPSGAGKSTLIGHLEKIDDRFVVIPLYTTRALRWPDEKYRISVPYSEMKKLKDQGKILLIMKIYETFYGVPKQFIDNALKQKKIPLMDWDLARINLLKPYYPKSLFVVYVEPQSISILESHLRADKRDKDGGRLKFARRELKDYYAGLYDDQINLKIKNIENKSLDVARVLYKKINDAL